MRVVVTGSSGFIGRHTVDALRRDDHEVVAIDRASGTDILTSDLAKAFPEPDVVIHLAGVLGTAELFDNIEHAIDVNTKGTARVLDACRVLGCAYVGITMPDCWPSVYQATKLAGVRLASAYHHAHGVPVTHIRAFNAYGPDQAYGPGHPQKIIPTFAARSWAGLPMPIWGDGDQTVDLVHVDHLAHVLAWAATYESSMYQLGKDITYDAGSGRETTVLDVAHHVSGITGCGLVEFLPMRSGEIPHTKLCAPAASHLTRLDHDLDHTKLDASIMAYRHAHHRAFDAKQ